MEKRELIAKQIIFAMAVNMIVFLIGPVRVAILARNLDLKEYGIFSTLMITVTLLTYFLTFGLDQYMARNLPSKGQDEQIRITKDMISFTLLVGIFFILAALIALFYIKNLKGYFIEISLVMVISVISIYFTLVVQYYYARKQLYIYNTLLLGKNVIWVVILVIYQLFYKISLQNVVWFWLIGLVLTIIAGSFTNPVLNLLIKEPRFDRTVVKNGLKYSLPMMPFFVGSWVLILGPRYILMFYEGAEKVAIYSIAYALIELLYLFVVNIPDMFFPHIIHHLSSVDEEEPLDAVDYKRLLKEYSLRYSMYLLVPGVIILLLFNKKIVLLLAGSKYQPSLELIPWLIPIAFMRIFSRVYEQELMIKNRTADIGIAYSFGVVGNLFFGFIFIPKAGVYGACWTALISFLIVLTILWFKKNDKQFCVFKK